MKQKKNKKFGICKLTGQYGKLVKSHLIPQGFINKEVKNEPFVQFLDNGRFKNNWTGWYDSTIVTREGEDILAELDSWAISTLRENKLVWSGWGNKKSLEPSEYHSFGDSGVRNIDSIDTNKLRVFLLSLLWRSAVSSLDEFVDITLSNDDTERLRRFILRETKEPISFFPISLTQYHTYGTTTLMAPLEDLILLPHEDGEISLKTYRFSFNGLIAQIENSPSENNSQHLGKLVLGSEDHKLSLVTRDFNSSREEENNRKSLEEHINNFVA